MDAADSTNNNPAFHAFRKLAVATADLHKLVMDEPPPEVLRAALGEVRDALTLYEITAGGR